MVLLKKELLPSVLVLTLVLLQLGSTVGCSSSCSDDQHGVGTVRPVGRRLLIGHEVLAKGLLMEHAKKDGEVLGEEKREVFTGPNPLHNR